MCISHYVYTHNHYYTSEYILLLSKLSNMKSGRIFVNPFIKKSILISPLSILIKPLATLLNPYQNNQTLVKNLAKIVKP
jgi:hypothetical protein